MTVALVGCGDNGNKVFECATDSNCDRHTGGDCVVAPSGSSWCAYPDNACATGLRYEEIEVGDGLAGMCVGSSVADAACQTHQ